MTYAAFRSSDKFYENRPPASARAARFAWDRLLEDGSIKSMRLLDGAWMCERSDGSLDEIDASFVRQQTRTTRS